MKPQLEVCLSPALMPLFETKDKIVVIIDIFRATSTMVAAIHNGAQRIIPVNSVQDCIELGQKIPNSITAGERNGQIAEGLQFGNSPSEFPKPFIENKTLILTTTNGTRLLHIVNEADQILIGAFLNISVLSQYLISQQKDVLLACASWKDRFNLEDSLFAGAVANIVKSSFTINCDSAHACMVLDDEAKPNYFEFLKRGAHYKRLSGFGLESDMVYCTSLDLHPVLPYLNGSDLVKHPFSE